jgi:hypothetical protein
MSGVALGLGQDCRDRVSDVDCHHRRQRRFMVMGGEVRPPQLAASSGVKIFIGRKSGLVSSKIKGPGADGGRARGPEEKAPRLAEHLRKIRPSPLGRSEHEE